MKKKAVYAGTFDPVAKFDHSIIERCVPLFDEITLLLVNNDRNCFFLPGERLDFLHEVASSFPNVKVAACIGLPGTYCQEHGIFVLIRAVQDKRDYEAEAQRAQRDKKLFPQLETFFLLPEPEHLYSTAATIKELAMAGNDVSPYLPASSSQSILEGFREHLAYHRYLAQML